MTVAQQVAHTAQALDWVMGGQPIRNIVWSLVDHCAHHRGALTVYSLSLGKVPPIPYGV
jgi:uncharacterized damage-inducible protein DinB